MKAEQNFHVMAQEQITRDPKVSLGGLGSMKEGRLSTCLSLLQPHVVVSKK